MGSEVPHRLWDASHDSGAPFGIAQRPLTVAGPLPSLRQPKRRGSR